MVGAMIITNVACRIITNQCQLLFPRKQQKEGRQTAKKYCAPKNALEAWERPAGTSSALPLRRKPLVFSSRAGCCCLLHISSRFQVDWEETQWSSCGGKFPQHSPVGQSAPDFCMPLPASTETRRGVLKDQPAREYLRHSPGRGEVMKALGHIHALPPGAGNTLYLWLHYFRWKWLNDIYTDAGALEYNYKYKLIISTLKIKMWWLCWLNHCCWTCD